MHPNHQSINTYFTSSISLHCVSARTKGFEAVSCELACFMVAVTTTWSIHHSILNESGKKLGWTMQKPWCNNLFFKQTIWAIHRTMKWSKSQWFTLRNTEGKTLVWWIQKNTPSCSFSWQYWAKSTFYSLWAPKMQIESDEYLYSSGLESVFYILLVPILDNSSHDFPYHLDLLYLQLTFCFIYCFPQLVIWECLMF